MILTFNVTFEPGSPEKFRKIGRSWHGVIEQIISQMGKLEISVYFRRARTSQFFIFFWTIKYRSHIVPALQLVEAKEMRKSLNLPNLFLTYINLRENHAE